MKNIEKYRHVIEEQGLDGILLTSRVSRLYCAEYDVAEGIAIVTCEGNRYFTDSRYIEVAEKNLLAFQVQMVDKDHSFLMLLQQAVKDFGVKKLGFEESFMTVEEFSSFNQNLDVELVPCQQAINKLRYVKEEWEIERMLQAQEITDQAFTEVLPRIHEGMTEKELAAELIYCLYKNGADGLSFDPIVVSGPNTSLPHGVPGDRKLQKGDFITMDFGCLYRGYCSDMTRTVALGYVTEEMRKVYETVKHAQETAICCSKAGVTGQYVDHIARHIIEDAGYGPYFGHGYGHSLGIEIHEAPNCNMRNTDPIPCGAVCSAEPGIYLPGKFGVRIEDVVIFTKETCIDITRSDKNLIVLEG